MAVCAIQTQAGLELQPLDAGGACSGVVLLQPVDVPPNPFWLSYEDGAAVSAAVASVWLLAWGYRKVSQTLSTRDEG